MRYRWNRNFRSRRGGEQWLKLNTHGGDIIIDPTSDRAKEAVGKQVYYSQFPNVCLLRANNDDRVLQGILISIDPKNSLGPFIVDGSPYACIIVKKEEPKPKYVPFESIEEFVERYTEVKEGTEFGTFEDNLLQCGMWIKSKDDDDLSQVTVIREYGICIDTMSTFVSWKNLLDDFEFIDDSPCGRLMEEKHE